MRLWLDDVRPMPVGYDWHCFTAQECIDIISDGRATFISFDHDLGEEKTGYDVACFIEKSAFEGSINPIEYAVHSANPVGRKMIDSAMLSAFYFWRKNKR